jgi:hypothetical protein
MLGFDLSGLASSAEGPDFEASGRVKRVTAWMESVCHEGILGGSRSACDVRCRS